MTKKKHNKVLKFRQLQETKSVKDYSSINKNNDKDIHYRKKKENLENFKTEKVTKYVKLISRKSHQKEHK